MLSWVKVPFGEEGQAWLWNALSEALHALRSFDFLSPVFLLSSPACPCTGNMQVPPFLCYARCWELWVRTHSYRLKRDGNCRLLYCRLVTAEDLECCLYFQTIVFSASGDQKCFMQTWIYASKINPGKNVMNWIFNAVGPIALHLSF